MGRKRSRKRIKRWHPPGTLPGTLVAHVEAGSEPAQTHMVLYGPDRCAARGLVSGGNGTGEPVPLRQPRGDVPGAAGGSLRSDPRPAAERVRQDPLPGGGLPSLLLVRRRRRLHLSDARETGGGGGDPGGDGDRAAPPRDVAGDPRGEEASARDPPRHLARPR